MNTDGIFHPYLSVVKLFLRLSSLNRRHFSGCAGVVELGVLARKMREFLASVAD